MKMPDPDQAVLARRAEIIAAMRTIVPDQSVISEERELAVYESDGLTAYHQLPMIVVLPETTAQVSQVLAYCQQNNVKIVPRGGSYSRRIRWSSVDLPEPTGPTSPSFWPAGNSNVTSSSAGRDSPA